MRNHKLHGLLLLASSLVLASCGGVSTSNVANSSSSPSTASVNPASDPAPSSSQGGSSAAPSSQGGNVSTSEGGQTSTPVEESSKGETSKGDSSSSNPAPSSSTPTESSSSTSTSQYEITESYWNENIVRFGYLGADKNLTFALNMSYAGESHDVVVLKNDYGKIEMQTNSYSGDYHVSESSYFEWDEGKLYSYSVDDATGTVSKVDVSLASSNMLASLYLSIYLVPFDFSSFTYDEAQHAYVCKSFSYDVGALYGQTGMVYDFTDIALYFDSGNLVSAKMKIVYSGMVLDLTITGRDFGTTKVTLPTVGGQGELPGDNLFVNKGFETVSVSTSLSEGDDMIKRAYGQARLALFDDGTFEAIVPGDSVKALIGTYTVGTNNNAILTTVYMYDADKGYNADIEPGYDALSFVFVADDTYQLTVPVKQDGMAFTLYLTMKVSSSAPMHYDLPEIPDIPDDDSMYLLDEKRWNEIFFGRDLLNGQYNFRVEEMVTPMKSGTGDNTTRTKLEVAGNVYHMIIENSYVGEANYYFVKNANATSGDGAYYDYYYQDTSGKWKKESAGLNSDYFDDVLGLLPISFDSLSYRSSDHSYFASSVKVAPYADDPTITVDYSNVKYAFRNGLPYASSYDFIVGQETHTYQYDYGNVEITLPDVNTEPEDPATLYSDIYGHVFDYVKSIDSDGHSDPDPDYAGAKLTFFEDGNIEYTMQYGVGEAIHQMAYVGKYRVSKATDAADTLIISGSFSGCYYDDQYTENSLSFSITFDLKSGLLYLEGIDNQLVFKDNGATPSHYIPTPVEVPPTSAWKAEDIAAALLKIDIEETLPEAEGIAGLEIQATDKNVVLKCTVSDDSSAYTVAMAYVSALLGDKGFTLVNYDEETGAYVLRSPRKEMVLTITSVEGDTSFQIKIEKYDPTSSYPSQAIASYLASIEATDTLPTLMYGDIAPSVSSSGDGLVLVYSLSASDKPGDCIASLIAILLKAGFTAYELSGETLYLSPNKQFVVALPSSETNYVLLGIMPFDASTMPSEDYPWEKIAAAIPENVTSYPSFALEGAMYLFEADEENGFKLQIFPKGDATQGYEEFISRLTLAGYVYSEDSEAYLNDEFGAGIFLSVEDSVICVSAYFYEPVINNVYTFTCTTKVADLDDKYIAAFVSGGDYGDGEWVEVTKSVSEDNVVRLTVELGENTAESVRFALFSSCPDILDFESEEFICSTASLSLEGDLPSVTFPTFDYAVTLDTTVLGSERFQAYVYVYNEGDEENGEWILLNQYVTEVEGVFLEKFSLGFNQYDFARIAAFTPGSELSFESDGLLASTAPIPLSTPSSEAALELPPVTYTYTFTFVEGDTDPVWDSIAAWVWTSDSDSDHFVKAEFEEGNDGMVFTYVSDVEIEGILFVYYDGDFEDISWDDSVIAQSEDIEIQEGEMNYSFTLEFPIDPFEGCQYVYCCETSWAMNDEPDFYAYVYGENEEEGMWVPVTVTENDGSLYFVFELPEEEIGEVLTHVKFARLDSGSDPSQGEIWNTSGELDLELHVRNVDIPTFVFLG